MPKTKAPSPRTRRPRPSAPAGGTADGAPAPGAGNGEEKSAGKFSGGRGGKGGGKGGRFELNPNLAAGKQLVIVESPAKAKTINKYLGPDYFVVASIGHIRDLPSKNPKGEKSPVPGIDLKHDFRPHYEVLPAKTAHMSAIKRAAKQAREVWFATDLDREGEAIAWHLADEIGISPEKAKRVIFAAITKDEIQHAFANPHKIDMDRVNAQQARRVLDRIVGYQVSPLLWKKVARGLSAGRVQSVAVRLVVEREREIRNFIPDEYWEVSANFSLDAAEAAKLAPQWQTLIAERDDKGNPRSLKSRLAWLGDHKAIPAELVEVGGTPVAKLGLTSTDQKQGDAPVDLTKKVAEIAQLAGLTNIKTDTREDESGKGPARFIRTVSGTINPAAKYRIVSVETKRATVRPAPPFITSTLQQSASTRLGFGARRTMTAAQQLYEGVDIPGEGPVGLITYMRTDSTHLTGQALDMARVYIKRTYGDRYLPEKPNFFSSSNKDAQEAHEAIRPTSLDFPPSRVKNALKPDQLRLYTLIWERFVACQMAHAEWDQTAVLIKGGIKDNCTFRATGRTLAFDGFYRVTGVPQAAETATLPALKAEQPMHPFSIDPVQKFTSPPARFSEASLIKMLESEGIGRPSTYASIISTIIDRKYVEQLERRLYATDLGEVVTDKLVEGFPRILDVGYTREMERELDKVEEDHLDWVDMLHRFYGPFVKSLEEAEATMTHAKAETTPAPKELRCPDCGSDMVYRFGRSGRFLSCSNYPECKYACPVDREGNPRPPETSNIACPKCGGPMIKRTGRFGPFLGCAKYEPKPKVKKTPPRKKKGASAEAETPEPVALKPGTCDGILNIDAKGFVVAPSQPPLVTDLACDKCGRPMNLRTGIRGPWLGCSGFPKCRGRGKWADVPEEKRNALMQALEAHDKANPVPVIRTLEGKALTDSKGKPLPDAPKVDSLVEGVSLTGESADDGAADEGMDEAA